MKRETYLAVLLLPAVIMMTGCSSTTGRIVDVNSYKGKQHCEKLNKDLIKVDKYIEVVEHTDAFHLEEEAVAIEMPDITISNNKKQMLKDANQFRTALLKERKTLGCK